MKIAMANDHAGTALKNQIKAYLEEQGHEVKDFGTYDEEGCDLSDFVYPAALAVAKGECERGMAVRSSPIKFTAFTRQFAKTHSARNFLANILIQMFSALAGKLSVRQSLWKSSKRG